MAASLTTSPNLGPLATTWTPPASCLSTITSTTDWDGDLWLGMFGNTVDLRCYPTNFATDDVYSPAICPSGWTSACSLGNAGIAAFSNPAITGIQCCPPSFTCDPVTNWDFCKSFAPTTSIQVLGVTFITSKNAQGSVVSTTTSSLISAVFAGHTVQAKPILVAYESSDLSLLFPGSTSSSTSQSGPASTSSAGGPAGSGGGQQGLSQGAKIAIGVAVPVGFLAIAACFFVILRYRRRRGQDSYGHQPPPGQIERYNKFELSADTPGPGPNGGYHLAEMSSERSHLPELGNTQPIR